MKRACKVAIHAAGGQVLCGVGKAPSFIFPSKLLADYAKGHKCTAPHVQTLYYAPASKGSCAGGLRTPVAHSAISTMTASHSRPRLRSSCMSRLR